MTVNKFSKPVLAITLAAICALPATFASARETRVEAGILTCHVKGGTGFIIGSEKNMTCKFKGIDDFTETYKGTVKKFGLDLGGTDYTTLKWAVFAPTTELESGALEGDYAGLAAEATLGVGIGANALIGGFDKSIALQPFSLQIQEGLNIAAGISTMRLDN